MLYAIDEYDGYMHLSISDIEDDLNVQREYVETAKLAINALRDAELGVIWISKDSGTRNVHLIVGASPVVEIICGAGFITVRKKSSCQTYVDHGWMVSVTERHFEYVYDPSFDWSVFIDWVKKDGYTVKAQSEL